MSIIERLKACWHILTTGTLPQVEAEPLEELHVRPMPSLPVGGWFAEQARNAWQRKRDQFCRETGKPTEEELRNKKNAM